MNGTVILGPCSPLTLGSPRLGLCPSILRYQFLLIPDISGICALTNTSSWLSEVISCFRSPLKWSWLHKTSVNYSRRDCKENRKKLLLFYDTSARVPCSPSISKKVGAILKPYAISDKPNNKHIAEPKLENIVCIGLWGATLRKTLEKLTPVEIHSTRHANEKIWWWILCQHKSINIIKDLPCARRLR